jgi:hypothetical protein
VCQQTAGVNGYMAPGVGGEVRAGDPHDPIQVPQCGFGKLTGGKVHHICASRPPVIRPDFSAAVSAAPAVQVVARRMGYSCIAPLDPRPLICTDLSWCSGNQPSRHHSRRVVCKRDNADCRPAPLPALRCRPLSPRGQPKPMMQQLSASSLWRTGVLGNYAPPKTATPSSTSR